MVRLVFRPYTQVRRTICTSVSLRASTRVSPGFALLRHSSPSFGSQQMCSYSDLSPWIKTGRRCSCLDSYFHFAYEFKPHILAHVYGLLGPCFKTGRMTPCRSTQRRKPAYRNTLAELLIPVWTEPLPARQARESSRPHKRSPCPVSRPRLPPKQQR